MALPVIRSSDSVGESVPVSRIRSLSERLPGAPSWKLSVPPLMVSAPRDSTPTEPEAPPATAPGEMKPPAERSARPATRPRAPEEERSEAAAPPARVAPDLT